MCLGHLLISPLPTLAASNSLLAAEQVRADLKDHFTINLDMFGSSCMPSPLWLGLTLKIGSPIRPALRASSILYGDQYKSVTGIARERVKG